MRSTNVSSYFKQNAGKTTATNFTMKSRSSLQNSSMHQSRIAIGMAAAERNHNAASVSKYLENHPEESIELNLNSSKERS